jgi:serine/threonine-protein kinase HipA
MVTLARVKIWGQYAGAVAWLGDQQYATFQYEPDFLRKGIDLAPIKMPIQDGARVFSFPELRSKNFEFDTFKGLPGLLADTLPDKYGNQIINSYLAQNGRSPGSMNPVEKLCFIGSRGMGALEFEPSELKQYKRSFNVEIDGLVDAAKRMLGERTLFDTNLSQDEEEAMMDILKVGTSAGGARPKAIIAYNDKTGEVKSGQTTTPKGFEQWLIKLDGVSDAQFGSTRGYGRVEMAYYLMAKAAGIDMMQSRLIEENGRAHFMTKRFDRYDSNSKFHVQTFCAMQHFDFNEVNSYSYEQLFQTMRGLRLPYPEAEELFRRMVFNVLARNCDDHTKNFAFRLKEGGAWELSPAYDICHAYRPNSRWVSQHALSVNGKRKDINKEDFLIVAKAMNIKKGVRIIEEVSEVVKQWPKFAKEVGIEKKLKVSISKTLIHLPK